MLHQNRCTSATESAVRSSNYLEACEGSHVEARGSLGDHGHLFAAQVLEGGGTAYCRVIVGDLREVASTQQSSSRANRIDGISNHGYSTSSPKGCGGRWIS